MIRLKHIRLNITDREIEESYALSSGKLSKYEYLTGEDLGYKPVVVEQAKFEYSPLGQGFTNILKKGDKVKTYKKYHDLVYSSLCTTLINTLHSVLMK